MGDLDETESAEQIEKNDRLERAKLAYAEAVRVVDEQAKARDAFRSRSAILFTVGSFAASILGFSGVENNPLFWIGLAAFGIAVGSSIFMYWPRDWQLNPGIDAVDAYLDKPTPEYDQESMLADLAVFHQENKKANNDIIDQLAKATSIGLAAVAVMISAWAANLVVADPPTEKVQKIQIVEGDH